VFTGLFFPLGRVSSPLFIAATASVVGHLPPPIAIPPFSPHHVTPNPTSAPLVGPPHPLSPLTLNPRSLSPIVLDLFVPLPRAARISATQRMYKPTGSNPPPLRTKFADTPALTSPKMISRDPPNRGDDSHPFCPYAFFASTPGAPTASPPPHRDLTHPRPCEYTLSPLSKPHIVALHSPLLLLPQKTLLKVSQRSQKK